MLIDEEIAPGISYHEHAKSVAMFNLRGVEYSEPAFRAEVLKVLAEIQPEQTEEEAILQDPEFQESLQQMQEGKLVDL